MTHMTQNFNQMKKLLILFVFGGLIHSCSGQSSSTNASSPPSETAREAPAETSQPATTAEQEEPLMARNIRNLLRNDLLKDDLDVMTEDQRRFAYEEYDLNNDGKKEYLVGFPQNSYFCGSGGCTFYLLGHEGEVVSHFTVADSPFVVLSSSTNGWRDLAVYSNGAMRKLAYDGTKYPSNPSVAPEYAEVPGDDLPRLLNFELPLPVYSF